MAEPAILALEDGTVFKGISVGAEGRTLGEVVFNTAMTGYQEILTDPSYYRQIVTLTYPHIGNVGTNSDDFESTKTFAAGLIIRDLSAVVSNWRAEGSLEQFLKRGKTVAIAEIDGPQVALALVDELNLGSYHAWHATRADLLRRIGRSDEAAAAYDAAIAATENEAERAYLSRRRAQLRG